jgi:CSLREA domain-containing protein
MNHKNLRVFLFLLSITVLLGLSLGNPGQVRAGVITVETEDDELDGGSGNGDCSLREAIANANNDDGAQADCDPGTGSDVIDLPAGTYTLTGAANDDSNLSGDLDITGILTINGDDARSTLIQAGTTSPIDGGCLDCVDRVIEIRLWASVVINDVTIRYGLAPDGVGNGDGYYGGGIYNAGDLTMNDCVVAYNRAGDGGEGNINSPWGGWGGNGGGIYTWDLHALTLYRTSVNHNRAGDGGVGYDGASGGHGGRGGGIAADSSSVINLHGSYVGKSDAGNGGNGGDGPGEDAGDAGNGGYGGGIYCNNCTLGIDNTSITENNSGAGGQGGYASGGDFDGGNGGIGGLGSGLFVSGTTADLTMSDSTVSENLSGGLGLGGSGSGGGSDGYDGVLGSGGGLALASAANANIQTSTFNQNRGFNGGGVQLMSGSQLEMVNSTLSTNYAAESGGGINCSGTSSDAALIFVTVSFNTADWDNDGSGGGGGFENTATLTVKNTIVSKNSDKGGQNPDCHGTGTSQDYNLLGIGDSAGCTFTPLTNDLVGTTATPIDPILSTLGDHGGSTWTHALKITSPAVDHIDTGTTGCGTGFHYDQRGVVRFSPCDIGSYELEQAEHIYLPLVLR